MADLNEELFDVRVIERNIRQGTISREDYEKYLSVMIDEADESTATETVMGTLVVESPAPESETGSLSE